MPGIAWSVMTRSIFESEWIRVIASAPEDATRTEWPRSSSIAAVVAATIGSSSTIQDMQGGAPAAADCAAARDWPAASVSTTGSQSSTVVPAPGWLDSHVPPSDCAAKP